MDEQQEQSFEDLKNRLDEIVIAVSDTELPLDEALDLYEEAVGLGLQASRIMEKDIADRDAAETSENAETAVSEEA